MTTVFGWWDWDANGLALVNRATGERLAFRGRVQEAGLLHPDETWLRFDYMQEELTFPLLVRETTSDLGRDGLRKAWTLDYGKSAAYWNQTAGGASSTLGYGRWRRVDDCATDALACWPETWRVRKGLHPSVWFRGGWLNGEWSVGWQRAYQRLPERRFVQSTPTEPDSWVQPLDESTPSRWTFHPLDPQVGAGENPSLEPQVLLKGLSIKGKGGQRRLVLPAEVPLDTLKGRTAYLLTEDNGRLLYPMAGETDPMRGIGHSSPQFRLLYADEDIVCELFGRPLDRRAGLARWMISSVPASLGSRSPAAAALDGDSEGVASTPLSRRLWLRIQWALFDAWSQWQGTTARSPQWLDGLHLLGADAITVRAGFRGGQLVGHLTSTIEKFRG